MVKKKSYQASSKKCSSKQTDVIAKRIITGIICAVIIIVGVAIACKFLLNEERITKTRMEKLAAEYYEGSLYESLIHGAMDQTEIEQAMDKYIKRGFAPVYLRQLLLYNDEKDTDGMIHKHCDENTTSVKFYPEAPYNKKSYRMEFQYDCDF